MRNRNDRAEATGSRAPPGDEFTEHSDRLPLHPLIEQATRLLALCGGAMVTVAILITLVSVVGRYGFGMPVPGDYELLETICAVGTFLFFPYAHATDSNIVVKFFTTSLPARQQRGLDLVHDVIFAAVAALLAWRLGIGLIGKFHSAESTMLIRIPYWWPYSFAVASMVLLCIVCIARSLAGIQAMRQ
jgi:TRAP-type C4-dicarboxylate transport system permease small subunit